MKLSLRHKDGDLEGQARYSLTTDYPFYILVLAYWAIPQI
jgi:hypothetical protein